MFWICIVGVVSEQTNQMAKATRGGDGERKETTGGEAEQ